VSTVTHTTDPVPSGAGFTTTACPICGPQKFTMSSVGSSPMTRTTEPNERGLFEVTPHTDWCPVFAGPADGVPAPCCGAPIHGLTHTCAYWLVVPGLDGHGNPVDHHVLDRDGTSRAADHATRREPAPEHDTIRLDPCGHTVEGPDVRTLLDALADESRRQQRAEGDRVLAGVADLLTAAERAGHGGLVAEYRSAVYGGLPTAEGLLVALRTVTR
jgi:hypothetical protein